MAEIEFPLPVRRLSQIQLTLEHPSQTPLTSPFTGTSQVTTTGSAFWTGNFTIPALSVAGQLDLIDDVEAFMHFTGGIVNTFKVPLHPTQSDILPQGTVIRGISAVDRLGTFTEIVIGGMFDSNGDEITSTPTGFRGIRHNTKLNIDGMLFTVNRVVSFGTYIVTPHRANLVVDSGVIIEWSNPTANARRGSLTAAAGQSITTTHTPGYVGPWQVSWVEVF